MTVPPPRDDDTRKSWDAVASVVARVAGGQGTYRSIASAWMLAGFGAISFVLIDTAPCSRDFLFSESFIVFTVAALTALGLFALWYQDQFVYQRLLNSAFTYGLFLEYKDPSLPQLRTVMYAHAQNILRRLSLYYLLPFILFGLVAWYADHSDTLNVACIPSDQAAASSGANQTTTETTADDTTEAPRLVIAAADHEAVRDLEANIVVVVKGLLIIALLFMVYIIATSKNRIAKDYSKAFPSDFQNYLAGGGFNQRLQTLDIERDQGTGRR